MKTATITNGQTVSAAVELEINNGLAAVQFPAAMTGTTLTFQWAPDGTNYKYIQNIGGGGRYSVTVAADEIVPVDPRIFKAVRRVKVVSSAAEGADRAVQLIEESYA